MDMTLDDYRQGLCFKSQEYALKRY